MPSVSFVTVDVFTGTRFGGNPLAVIPDARGLSDARMQQIAREFNYSESTFVLPPADARNTAQVRIFTPTAEIPFAGHPNVGTAFVLGTLGAFGWPVDDTMRFEEKAGIVEVRLRRDRQAVTGASIRAPRGLEVGQQLDRGIVAACASIAAEDLRVDRHEPVFASVGLAFAFAEVRGLDMLSRARPSESACAVADQRYPQQGNRFLLFLYTRLPDTPAKLRARMFSPLINVPEDPATGSGAAALGAYLALLRPEPDLQLELSIEQGVEMGRPSVLELDVQKAGGSVRSVVLSGQCVAVMRGSLDC